MAEVPNSGRLVVEGSMPGGERFAFGWAFDRSGPLTGSAAAIAASVEASTTFRSFMTAVRAIYNTNTTATTLRCYLYGAGGTLADTGSQPIATGGGTGGANTPNQIAIVVSLRTANATRSGRGRMYCPANGVSVDSTGRILPATATSIATPAAALMLATGGAVSSKTTNQFYLVQQVRVGTVLDTIRARRNRIVEQYSIANV